MEGVLLYCEPAIVSFAAAYLASAMKPAGCSVPGYEIGGMDLGRSLDWTVANWRPRAESNRRPAV
jgi:hypothetical protein